MAWQEPERFGERVPRLTHAQQRASERYGVRLSREDLAQMSRTIAENRSVKLRRREDPAIEDHLVAFDVGGTRRVFRVVYDTALRCIRTFLPPWESRR